MSYYARFIGIARGNPLYARYCAKTSPWYHVPMNWWRLINILLLAALAGGSTSSGFILVHDIFTRDTRLDLWEFGVILSVPIFVAIAFSIVSKTRFTILLSITYLTFLIPTLGAAFGSSGSEPLWQFTALGLSGGLAWGIPFALWQGRAASKRR